MLRISFFFQYLLHRMNNPSFILFFAATAIYRSSKWSWASHTRNWGYISWFGKRKMFTLINMIDIYIFKIQILITSVSIYIGYQEGCKFCMEKEADYCIFYWSGRVWRVVTILLTTRLPTTSTIIIIPIIINLYMIPLPPKENKCT